MTVAAKLTDKPAIEDRNERVMANQGLVHQVARGFRNRGVDLEDLVQFGNLGLMRAAEKFDPGRGLRFSTYAVYWIRHFIYEGLANASRPIRVPQHAQREVTAINRRAEAIEEETGVKPWLSDVVAEMEVHPVKRERLLSAAAADTAKFGVKPLEEVVHLTPQSEDPQFIAIHEEHREQLGRAMELLSEEHRQVLTWRYGLDGSPPLVIMATAALLGIGWRAAERMERAAIKKLKRLLNR